MIKQCLNCKNDFRAWAYQIKKGEGNYCSSHCLALGKWKNPTEKMLKHIKKAQKIAWKVRLGSKHSLESINKISNNRKGKNMGENNPKWKGDKVQYQALHSWISRTLGKPSTCEECKLTNLFNHKIHWANLSGKYKRELTDWKRLCAKCHLKLDGHKRWNNIKKNYATI